ncbi:MULTISPECIES: CRISPR-associated endoribonuclease Cas6 [Romboutsia]|uniref:CRISPR-associated endoribonuclease Cas6 n=1 Tax=Romboutsia TaxID=1501226 RepID=UPI00216D2C85|nr:MULTISPECIES: CRISPR-associated endoribonuclease Cas6 [Romboutsia]MCI9260391.1 CRISPR-associated endoribonuclease Cas6 [Romboutsia sp.]
MRFYLTFELEKNSMPKDYRRVILSYIKKSLTEILDGKYYSQYFKDTIQKDFCFSLKLPKAKFAKDEIILEDNSIKVLFTSDDRQKTGLLLQQAFMKQKNKKFLIPNQNSITLKQIHQQREQKITSSKVIFKTYGLCVRDHNKETNKDNHYVYSDEKFNEQLKVVLKNQISPAGFSKDIVDSIKFSPINCKKVLVKHYDTYVDTTVGSFLLEGNPLLLQYLYDVGMGSRNTMFGYLDLVTQDL